MLITTPAQIMETLKHYDPNEQLMITWWSAEDVELLIEDESQIEQAKEIWDDVVWTLDKHTSDMVISDVNDELYRLVEDRINGETESE
jgi:hypothetical protein